MSDLISNIKKAIQISGYPLEQRVGNLLTKGNWHPFHSVNYTDPITGVERELDILAYKVINDRRIELRISCKRSSSKPWIFFTEDSNRYLKSADTLKRTPVKESNHNEVFSLLKDLRFFNHGRRAINFTSFSGKDLTNEARTSIKDGIYSSINSVYHRVFPNSLLFDERGTIYFFITIFDGQMFESYYDPISNDDILTEIDYMQYQVKFPLAYDINQDIQNSVGKKVKLKDVVYWFSDWFNVEIVKWNLFENYINEIEAKFASLSKTQIDNFGKSWTPENFPKIVGHAPKISE